MIISPAGYWADSSFGGMAFFDNHYIFVMRSKLSIFLLIIGSLVVFAYSSHINYEQHAEAKRAFVQHPEFVPTAPMVRLAA